MCGAARSAGCRLHRRSARSGIRRAHLRAEHCRRGVDDLARSGVVLLAQHAQEGCRSGVCAGREPLRDSRILASAGGRHGAGPDAWALRTLVQSQRHVGRSRRRPWVNYLARCSYLLQQGHFYADVAYFYGEEGPLTAVFGWKAHRDAPDGYGFDFVNSDVILHQLQLQGWAACDAGRNELSHSLSRRTQPAHDAAGAAATEGPGHAGRGDCGQQAHGFAEPCRRCEADQVADSMWGSSDPMNWRRVAHSVRGTLLKRMACAGSERAGLQRHDGRRSACRARDGARL